MSPNPRPSTSPSNLLRNSIAGAGSPAIAIPPRDLLGAFLPDVIRTIALVSALGRTGEIDGDLAEALASGLSQIPGDLGISSVEVLDHGARIWEEIRSVCDRLAGDLLGGDDDPA